jgi:hypothetical protein
MSAKYGIAALLIAFVVSHFIAHAAFAALWRGDPNRTWSAVSSNGKYIFAVVSTLPIDQEVDDLLNPDRTPDELTTLETQIREVRRQFPRTGMYLNDGSRTPIWTPNRPVYRGVPSADGRRLVAMGEGAASTTTFDLINVYESNGNYWEISKDDVVPMIEYIIRRLCNSSWDYDYAINITPAADRVKIETNFDDAVEFSLVNRARIKTNTTSNTMRIFVGSWNGRIALLAIFVILGTIVWQIGRWRFSARQRAPLRD